MSKNLIGSLFMIICMFGYASSDVFMKYSGALLPLSQSLFIRGLIVVSFISIIAIIRNELVVKIRRTQIKYIAMRILGDVGGTFLFLLALFKMKIANVTAILQCLPLMLTLIAVLFLKEVIGWRRWTAIFLGLFGVLLIIKPMTKDFNENSIFALGAVLFIVIRDLFTRKIDKKIPSILIALLSASSVTFFSFLLMQFQDQVTISIDHMKILFCSAIFLILGILFNVMSMRVGELGFVSIFRYAIIFFAMIYGILFFSEIPDIYSIFGIIIIIMSGIYTLHRENKVRL